MVDDEHFVPDGFAATVRRARFERCASASYFLWLVGVADDDV